MILRRDDSKLWIAYDNISSKADAVKEASGEEEEVKEEPEKEDKEDGQPVLTPPNKWVMKIVEEILNTFNGSQTLDELIFGPGMPIPEKKGLSEMARRLELKVNTRQRDGQGYVVIHKSFPPAEMVKILLLNQGTSGKYSLIPTANLPKHADIEDKLRRVNPLTNHPRNMPPSGAKKGISLIKGQQAQSIMLKMAGIESTSMDSQNSGQKSSQFGKPKINWH